MMSCGLVVGQVDHSAGINKPPLHLTNTNSVQG